MAVNKLTLKDLPVNGKKILMRVDFNVPLNEEGEITDDTRIQAALPSIHYVLEQGGSLILMSHLGRPKGHPQPRYSLEPCAKRLFQLLKIPVTLAPNCTGEETKRLAQNLKPGQILLLENLRFHKGEEHPDQEPSFAKEIASYGDAYVNDAFGTAHRSHASVTEVPKLFPGKAAMGFLMEKEIQFLSKALLQPKRPFYALIGGAKISSKLGVMRALVDQVDALLVGGGMAFTFLKAQGIEIGDSICEEDLIPEAKDIMNQCKHKKIPFLLPKDIVISNRVTDDAPIQTVSAKDGIPLGFEGLDIGPETVREFSAKIQEAATVFWNGPVGLFEIPHFARGTLAIAEALASSSAISIVGGGDSIAAVKQLGQAHNLTHLSTGGGAALELIEYGTLPGLDALSNRIHQGVVPK